MISADRLSEAVVRDDLPKHIYRRCLERWACRCILLGTSVWTGKYECSGALNAQDRALYRER